MSGQQTRYADTCDITGIMNNITVEAEILSFRKEVMLIATIERAAKVTLYWDQRSGLYIGSLGEVEFQSPGPKAHTFRTGRL